MDDQELTPWQEIGPTIRAERSVQVQTSSLPVELRRTDIRDLVPVTDEEFFHTVGPCLALTGGVGMSRQDQRAWLEAAFIALKGMPIRLLERGAEAAMRTADHPSKIIPAIVKETKEDWEWRKRMSVSDPRPTPTAPKVIPEAERREVAVQMRELVKGIEARMTTA